MTQHYLKKKDSYIRTSVEMLLMQITRKSLKKSYAKEFEKNWVIIKI